MLWQLSTLGGVASAALVTAITPIGPAVFGGPVQGQIALRPIALLAAVFLLAGFRLGLAYVQDPSVLATLNRGWWILGWLGAISMFGVSCVWLYQLTTGNRLGLAPDGPPESAPFSGPPQEELQYLLRAAAFGIPLLVPWIDLLRGRRRAVRSNTALERSRDR